MNNVRAYTWFCVTYAKPNEYQPLLDKASHWALAHHDKDFIIADNGDIKPKAPHTHIIVTFTDKQSFNQVKSLVKSEQNTLAQPCNTKDGQGRDCVRGMFKYLTHEGEDPAIKYIYDKTHRRTDDDAYWQKRIGEDLQSLCHGDNFLDDLIADDFSVLAMGRKYGRDFMKNYGRYCDYRRECLWELKRDEAMREMNELIATFKEYGIPLEDFHQVKIKFQDYIKQNYTKEKKSYADTYYRKF